MARTVYIFGAGASHGMGTPLLAGFIDAADDLRRSSWPITRTDFDLVFDVINQRLPTLHAKSTQDIQNLETVFNLIEMGELLGRFPKTEPEELRRLSKAIRTVLSETIEFTSRFTYSFSERHWSPPSGYNQIVAECFPRNTAAPGDFAFITFNYDIGLDFALAEHAIPYDYSLGQIERTDKVPLLKLHGSLNWCATSGPDDIGALQIPTILEQNGPPKQTSVGNISLPLQIKRSFHLLRPGMAPDETPSATLIPPTWNKTQFHRTFQTIWQRAAKELSEASEIIVIGYSYPLADEFFHALLALGLAGSSRVRRFLVVDPDPNAGARFHDVLGPDTRSRFSHRPVPFEYFLAGGEHNGLRLRPIGTPT